MPFLSDNSPLETSAIPLPHISFKLQVSGCSTLYNTSDVPDRTVLFSPSIEFFSGMTFKLHTKPFVALPVTPVITHIILHFRSHVRFVSVPKCLCLRFFYAFLCVTFLSAGIATL